MGGAAPPRAAPSAGSVGIEGRALPGLAELEVAVEGEEEEEEGVWLQKEEASVRVASSKAVEKLDGGHSPSRVEG